jgi:hypothetical protein
VPLERDDSFWVPGSPYGLDRDPNNVLSRMQGFDNQDAAGLGSGSSCLALWLRVRVARGTGLMVVVASVHRCVRYLVMAHLGIRLLLQNRGLYLGVR